MSENTEEFLNTVNQTQKKLGHNKYQIEIECLQGQLAKTNQENKEQNMEIELLKTTIENLQKELDNTQAIDSANKHSEELTLKLNEKQSTIESLEKSISQLKLDLESKTAECSEHNKNAVNTTNTLEELLTKYSSLSESNNHLQELFDKQTNDFQNSQAQLEKEQNKLMNERNISQSLRQQIEDIKFKIADYQTQYEDTLQENNNLRDEIKKLQESMQNTDSQISGSVRIPRHERVLQRRRR